MTKLTVRCVAGKFWQADLRPWGLGRRVVDGVPPDPAHELDAIQAGWALLFRLTRGPAQGATTNVGPSAAADVLSSGGGIDGETLFRFACDSFTGDKEFDSDGGAKYGRQYLGLVRRELGAVRISAFEAPAGFAVLKGYRDDCSRRGLGAQTRANRLNVVMQVLGHCQERGWLKAPPRRPKPNVTPDGSVEPLRRPSWDWLHEHKDDSGAGFRALRAEIGRGSVRLGSCPQLKDRASADDFFARRRLYLSFAFYTGLHTRDLDELTADSIGIDTDTYMRRNSKSSAFIKEVPIEMPEQLRLDIYAELERLGRRWHRGEQICGGKWLNGSKVLTAACRRAGVPKVNDRILRRSCARMYALMGWNERDISEVLGHVDQKMIREVYVRIPVRERSPERVPWTVANSRLPWLAMSRPKRILPFERQPQLFAVSDDED